MASGTTRTERLLYKLCRNSFLRLWTYANVFRDQGKKGDGDGKELCDALVVFGSSVLIFSDKECKYPNTGNAQLDWTRWRRRTIEASKKQLDGAERWIRKHPERVFVDRRCTEPLDVKIPSGGEVNVYKIVVASGASSRCKKYYQGQSGSLILVDLTNKDGSFQSKLDDKPFVVPLRDDNGDIYHILNGENLEILLGELDTIYDFVGYLSSKEDLIESGRLLCVHGEEDLVGMFLGIGAQMPDMLGLQADTATITIAEGIYADILSRDDYRKYVQENTTSYFWDNLIENHVEAVFDGTLVQGSDTSVDFNEKILRVLASESRVNRRLLSDSYIDLCVNAPRDLATSRTVKWNNNLIYVFQAYPKQSFDSASYREDRQNYLVDYCFLTGWRNQEAKQVVGISTDPDKYKNDGFDLLLMEFDGWPEEKQRLGERVNAELAEDVMRPLHRTRINMSNMTAWSPQKPSAGHIKSTQRRYPYKKRKAKKRKR